MIGEGSSGRQRCFLLILTALYKKLLIFKLTSVGVMFGAVEKRTVDPMRLMCLKQAVKMSNQKCIDGLRYSAFIKKEKRRYTCFK